MRVFLFARRYDFSLTPRSSVRENGEGWDSICHFPPQPGIFFISSLPFVCECVAQKFLRWAIFGLLFPSNLSLWHNRLEGEVHGAKKKLFMADHFHGSQF
jgi:hypothetical protein